jgi:small-conductance mechanosensitive channel
LSGRARCASFIGVFQPAVPRFRVLVFALMALVAVQPARAARDDERVAALQEQMRTLQTVVDSAKNPQEKQRLETRLKRLNEELSILQQRQQLEARERDLQSQRSTSPLELLREKLRGIDTTTEQADLKLRALGPRRQQAADERDGLAAQVATERAKPNANGDRIAQLQEQLYTKNEELRALALEFEATDAELDLARSADRLRERVKGFEAANGRTGMRALFEAYTRVRDDEKAGDQLDTMIAGLAENLKFGLTALELAQQKLAKFDEEFAVLERQTNFLNRAPRIEKLLAEERNQKAALVERMPFLARQIEALRRSETALRSQQELASLRSAFQEEQLQAAKAAYLHRLKWPGIALATLLVINLIVSRALLPLRYKKESLLFARRLLHYLLMLIAVTIGAAYLFDDISAVITTLGVASAALVISLQDVCASIFGWFVIMSSGKVKIGDRVEIDGTRGDVLDIQLLRTTLLEINGWLGLDQPTGRVLVISNSYIFKSKVFNFNHGHPFIWGKIDVTITFATPVASALKLFHRVLEDETREDFMAARNAAATMQKRYGVEDADYQPKIYTHIADSGVTLSLVFVSHYKNYSLTRNRINRRLVAELETHQHIQLAYHTLSLLQSQTEAGAPAAVLGPDETQVPFAFSRAPGAK